MNVVLAKSVTKIMTPMSFSKVQPVNYFHSTMNNQMPFIGMGKNSQKLKDKSHPYVYPGDATYVRTTFVSDDVVHAWLDKRKQGVDLRKTKLAKPQVVNAPKYRVKLSSSDLAGSGPIQQTQTEKQEE